MSADLDRDLSVIIPTRNRPGALERCLDALGRQTLAPNRFEVIVVDDGSGQRAVEVAQGAVGRARFRATLLRQVPKGPAAARNLGIDHARGRRILFIGDDIIASDRLLEQHLAAAAEHGDCAVLGFTDWAPALRLTPFMRYLAPERGPQFRYATIADPLDCGYQFFYTSNISLDRHWLELERFDEAFPYACLEDADLGYRLQKRGLRIVFHRAALAYHDHAVSFGDFLERVRQMGQSNVRMYEKYPELRRDENAMPSEGYRARLTRSRRLRMAALAAIVALADRLRIPLGERVYERVLEHYFVSAFFEALDRHRRKH